jgi:C4-type Zn-finger protein
MWCPICQTNHFDISLLNFKDGVVADKMICKKCGYSFLTVWSMKVRQEFVNTQINKGG